MKISEQQRKRLIFIYEVSLPFLALIALFLLVALGGRYFHPSRQSAAVFLTDHLIWFIFTADFFVRLCFTKKLRLFFAAHLTEFISIIPVMPFIMMNDMFLRFGFTTSSMVIMNVIFIIKFLAYLGRAYAMQSRFFRTNLLHYAGGITIVTLVVSALLYADCERITYGNALWFSIVTMTTTGYGDIVPKTDGGRIIAVLLMVAGVACITAFTGILSGRIMNSYRLGSQTNPHLRAIEEQLHKFALLSEDEVEEICIVLKGLKNHQKLTVSLFEEEMLRFREEEADIAWQKFPAVRWVRKHFASIINDSDELDAKLRERRETKTPTADKKD